MEIDFLDDFCAGLSRYVKDYEYCLKQYQQVKKRLTTDTWEYTSEEAQDEINYFLLRVKQNVNYGFGFKRRIDQFSEEEVKRLEMMPAYIEFLDVLKTSPEFLSKWT